PRAAHPDASRTHLRVDGTLRAENVSDWVENVHADPLTAQLRSRSFRRRPVRIVEGPRGPIGMVPDLPQENGPTDRVMTSSGPFLLFPWWGARATAVSNGLHPVPRGAA